MGNPCGIGACIPTSITSFKCDCPIGYDGVGCLGKNFILFFSLFSFFSCSSKFNTFLNRY